MSVGNEPTMREDDIYKSKRRYELFTGSLSDFAREPQEKEKRKYWCKHEENLKYFSKLFKTLESKNTSYVRRLSLIRELKLICHNTTKDLSSLERGDIDSVVGDMHKVYKSPKAKRDFIRNIKYLWKLLFPEVDERGRIDDDITPYPVRHLKAEQHVSTATARRDKLTWEEFERIVKYFSSDVRLQAYLTLAVESLGRPQEILYCKLGDVERSANETWAKINISSHGKTGLGILQSIDSYPYLSRWLSLHPLRSDSSAFLFVNLHQNAGSQLTPYFINKQLKKACNALKIDKPITCYSLKRCGVTIRRLRGDSDMQIQQAARWTSSKQLKTYDFSDQEDSFKIELAKRGLIQDDSYKQHYPTEKPCLFCGEMNGHADDNCSKCKRSLDRNRIAQESAEEQKRLEMLEKFLDIEQVQKLFKTLYKLDKRLSNVEEKLS